MVNSLIQKGITETEIAKKIGVTQSTVNRIKKGSPTNYQTGKALERLCENIEAAWSNQPKKEPTMSYVSSKDLKTECIKGYFKSDVALEIRQLARKNGMSTSHFVRAVVQDRIYSEKLHSANNVVNLDDFRTNSKDWKQGQILRFMSLSYITAFHELTKEDRVAYHLKAIEDGLYLDEALLLDCSQFSIKTSPKIDLKSKSLTNVHIFSPKKAK